LESIGESDEFLVPVTLNLGLDEVTNWFNMSHVTPPVELNEIIQYSVKKDLAKTEAPDTFARTRVLPHRKDY
jgi:hypothetical protein